MNDRYTSLYALRPREVIITSAMQGIKGASLSEKGLIRSITGGSRIVCMSIAIVSSAGIYRSSVKRHASRH